MKLPGPFWAGNGGFAMKILRLASLSACLLLGGCFMGGKPLITTKTADYPFKDGVHFAEETNCASTGQLVCNKNEKYHQVSTGTLHIKNKTYVLAPDPNSTFAMAGAGGGSDAAVLIKSVGDGYYVVQMDSGAAPGGDTGPGADMRYLYEFMKLDGKTAYAYSFTCEQNGDARYVKAGKLASIASVMGMPACHPNSLANLAAVFRDRVANGAVPSERIVFN